MNFFTFQWHITDECDQRCEHCYIFAEDNNAPVGRMTLAQMATVLDEMEATAERFGRRPYIYLTGGDPILHPNFWELLKLLKDREIPFSIMGNPFHLTDDVCRSLKNLGCEKYQLSLDGTRETHDAIRKPGSFDSTLAKITTINNSGMKSVVMTTVSTMNIDQMPELIDTVVARGVSIYAFARYCATSLERDAQMEPLQYRELLDTCWHKFKAHEGGKTAFSLKDHLWTLYRYEEGDFQIPSDVSEGVVYEGCNCGISHMTILPNGDVFACRRMESKVGNIFEVSLFDIFLGQPMDAYRDVQKLEKCSKCELLRFCRGCPAVAHGATHNQYAPDPQCWKELD